MIPNPLKVFVSLPSFLGTNIHKEISDPSFPLVVCSRVERHGCHLILFEPPVCHLDSILGSHWFLQVSQLSIVRTTLGKFGRKKEEKKEKKNDGGWVDECGLYGCPSAPYFHLHMKG